MHFLRIQRGKTSLRSHSPSIQTLHSFRHSPSLSSVFQHPKKIPLSLIFFLMKRCNFLPQKNSFLVFLCLRTEHSLRMWGRPSGLENVGKTLGAAIPPHFTTFMVKQTHHGAACAGQDRAQILFPSWNAHFLPFSISRAVGEWRVQDKKLLLPCVVITV